MAELVQQLSDPVLLRRVFDELDAYDMVSLCDLAARDDIKEIQAICKSWSSGQWALYGKKVQAAARELNLAFDRRPLSLHDLRAWVEILRLVRIANDSRNYTPDYREQTFSLFYEIPTPTALHDLLTEEGMSAVSPNTRFEGNTFAKITLGQGTPYVEAVKLMGDKLEILGYSGDEEGDAPLEGDVIEHIMSNFDLHSIKTLVPGESFAQADDRGLTQGAKSQICKALFDYYDRAVLDECL